MRIGESTFARLPQHLQALFLRLPNYGSEEVVKAFPSPHGAGSPRNGEFGGQYDATSYDMGGLREMGRFGDEGSAARFFYTAQITDEDSQWAGQECRNAPAKCVDECLSLQSEAVVSVLSDAVAMSADRLTLQRQSYRAHSTNVTAPELKLICEAVTEVIQSIERRYLLGLPLESITARLGHVMCAATPNRIGITTITINRLTSDHSVELVTFNTIETSVEAGASDYAKRFHYTSKADSDDRLGSRHPTVKPVDLMQWLVRLVTQPGGTVLDCFAGTGTTGEAAWREGMRAVLIEREEEYQADIRRRMALALAGPNERSRESVKARGKTEGHEDLPLFAGNEAGKFTSAA